MSAAPARGASPAELVSFVPRLTLEWLRDEPDRLWRNVEGTLAFVDISGFTAMSERLSALGKAGAEEVTDVMNATFAGLLEIAYSYGGGLLKFGGDALLLLFSGEGHTARAARASFGMRRRLRAIGRPRTSAGAVTLRMHVGIHSGDFHFFLVGDSHRELLVTGPAASETVAMEAASEAGEILLSPAAAEELDPAHLGEEKGEGVLLAREPEAPGGLEPLPDVSAVPLELAVPAPLRAQLLEVGPLEGEHRNAAIGFLRFAGIDEVIESEGPEAAADALDALVRTVQQAAAEHDVTFLESDIDRDGGRIVLVAGAPQTFGDDEERLLRTLRTAVDAGVPFPVHVGASRGRVFAGQVGAPFRRTYTVLGDTAALAARLMAKAGEDEIYVAAEAFERLDGRFAGTELEPLRLKGKSEPARAYALGALEERAVEVVDRAEAKLPFVDRERERAVLSASVAPVRMGFGTMVELIGEPGIGKSRLAEELRAQCDDMTFLTARCDQYEASTAYHPFRPLLRSLLGVDLNGGSDHNREVLTARLGELDGELGPWAPLLSAPLDVEVESTPQVDELDPSFRRARLHGVVGSLLGRLLGSPTLMVFEDVHWMDEASSDLLRHLGTQLASRPWLTCTTRRPVGGGFAAAEGTPPLPALTLRLEPLPADDARTLIEAAAGRPLAADELEALAERGAGNPLFLQELASADSAADDAEELPETVHELVRTRIDRLAPGDRTLLRWASVLGQSFAGAVIADVLADDPSAAADSEAWDRLVEFVERDPDVAGAFRFRHALIRDAAYEGLSFRRRRELHDRVAEVLERRYGDEADEGAELLSLHFSRAERAAETWRYSVAAGRRAQGKWANIEAAEFYRRALDAAKQLPDLPDHELAGVWEALGDCVRLTGDLEDAAYAFSNARKLVPPDGVEQVKLIHKEGAVREEMGRYPEALRWYARGLKIADGLPEAARKSLRMELGMAAAQTRLRQGRFRDCIQRCQEVVRYAHERDDMRYLAHAYLLLHVAHMLLGSPERVAFRGLALPLFEELGDLKSQASALNNLGIEAYYEGDWAKAREVYERSRALYERIGDVMTVAVVTNNIGEILSDQGHLHEADRLFEEVIATAEPAGHRRLAMIARANLGRSAARAGRLDEAESLLAEALQGFREIQAATLVLETELRLAEVDVLRGDRAGDALARAEAVLARQDDSARMAGPQAAAHRIRGAALHQLAQRAAGNEALVHSARVAREADATFELALALDLARVFAGDDDAARQSSELLTQLGVEHVARPPVGS